MSGVLGETISAKGGRMPQRDNAKPTIATDPSSQEIISSVNALLAEKEQIARREQELIQGLNGVLRQMGYEVIRADGQSPPAGRRRGRPPGRRPGRPPGRRGPGRPPKAESLTAPVMPRRRGRPPKNASLDLPAMPRRRGRPPKNAAPGLPATPKRRGRPPKNDAV